MNKERIFRLILVTYTFCCSHSANAQTYTIESFQNVARKINLYYKPFTGILAISSGKDTLLIENYLGTQETKVINKKFLMITYNKLAGSNEGLRNTLLLAVDNGRLIQAIHIKSFSEFDMRNVDHVKGNFSEYQQFRVKIKLLGHDRDTYKLNLTIHDESRSERTPKTDHNYNKSLLLSFDGKENVFYSSREKMSTSFRVYDPGTKAEIKQDVNGVVPVIKIEGDLNYYIGNEWYEKGTDNYLVKYVYRKPSPSSK